jgi:hypothetical protein
LLSFAVEGSTVRLEYAILDELEYHEQPKLIRRGSRRDEAHRRAARLITAMRTAVDDAEAPGCGRAMLMNYGRARSRSRET